MPQAAYRSNGVHSDINSVEQDVRAKEDAGRTGGIVPIARSSGARQIWMYFAVTKAYALQGDAQIQFVSTDESGLGFRHQ